MRLGALLLVATIALAVLSPTATASMVAGNNATATPNGTVASTSTPVETVTATPSPTPAPTRTRVSTTTEPTSPTATEQANQQADEPANQQVEVGNVSKVGEWVSRNSTTVVRSLGQTGYISDFEAHSEQNAVTLTFVLSRPETFTLADGQGIDPERSSGSYYLETMTLPRGTVEVTVEATHVRNNHVVTINGGALPDDRAVYVSTGNDVPDGGLAPDRPPEWEWIAYSAVAVTAAIAIRIAKNIRKRERGHAVSAVDGTELSESRVYGKEAQVIEEDDDD